MPGIEMSGTAFREVVETFRLAPTSVEWGRLDPCTPSTAEEPLMTAAEHAQPSAHGPSRNAPNGRNPRRNPAALPENGVTLTPEVKDTKPPRHRHEMTLRLGVDTPDDLCRKMHFLADDLEREGLDEEREVISSSGYRLVSRADFSGGSGTPTSVRTTR